ncbi:MAG TPA: nuclear transport factor 2 family protein [Candidatus Saccharimonadia bacterium]|nr:nuclear transport factor 2 family protein [Candidatus Saccharimonadia bacterium]
MTEPQQLAEAYFTAWKSKDFTTFRSLLADEATFVGPMGQARNADECVQGIQRLAETTKDIVILKMFVNGPDVLTWYELHTVGGQVLPTANWSHTQAGKITEIRAVFDPRPLFEA